MTNRNPDNHSAKGHPVEAGPVPNCWYCYLRETWRLERESRSALVRKGARA